MIFVAELTAAIDSAGTLQTFLVTSGGGFTTKPLDTPANIEVSPRLLDPGTYRRELFSGSRVFGAVTPSYGSITISNPDGALDGWANYGFSGRDFILRAGESGGAYPSSFTTVFKCTMSSLTLSDRDIQIGLTDRLSLLDRPVLNTYLAGTGGVEGDSTMTGKPLPRAFLNPGWVPLKTLDASNLIYVLHKEAPTGFGAFIGVYDGGVEVPRGSDYTSVSALLTTAPASGTCRVYQGGPTYIRLGTTPTYELRATANGWKPGGLPYTFADLAIEAGITDATTINAPTAVTQQYIEDASTTFLDVLEESCKYNLSYFFLNRQDIFISGEVLPPTGAASYTFTRNNCISMTKTTPDFSPIPVYKLNVLSGDVWPCTVAGGAPEYMRDYLQRTGQFTSYVYENPTILNKHRLALSDVVKMTQVLDTIAFSTFASKYMALFGTERDQVMLEVIVTKETLSDLLALELMSVVEVKTNRFGYTSGKNFRIINIEYKLASNRIGFVLWG